MRILIVDDSRSMRAIVRRALRQAGYGGAEVQEAENGAEGLKAVESFDPNLIFCDWNMPVMGGYDLLLALNAQGRRPPFGFVSSEATPEVRRLAADAGARFFILKPFAPASFEDVLNAVFKGGAAEVFQVQVHVGDEVGRQKLPNAQSVSDTLSGLLGKPVTAMEWRTGIEPGVPVVIATYRVEGVLSHVYVCDLAFAGYTAGALTLTLDSAVKAALASRKLPEALAEMTREVFNVLARLSTDAHGHQPKLDTVAFSPTPPPPDAAALVKTPGFQAHMIINVPGYGKGRLSGITAR